MLQRQGLAAVLILCMSLVSLWAVGTVQAAPPSGHKDASDWRAESYDIPDPATGGRGGQVYTASCAACHDTGVNRAPHRALLSMLPPQSIYKALTTGVMRPQAAGLSDSDKVAVAEFMTRHRLGEAVEAAGPPRCTGKTATFDVNEPPPFVGWGLTPGNTRFIPAATARVDRESAQRMRLKWAIRFPHATRLRSQPALAGGGLYVGSQDGVVYALDRATGCVRWTFQAGGEVRSGIVISPWTAGDRTAKPIAYFGDLLGNVYAVDARHGALIWRLRPDTHPSATITASPALFENVLYVPVSSLEVSLPADPNYECCRFRGSVVAVDARSGEVRWQSYTIPTTPAVQGRNAVGATRYGPSGAPVWNTPTIDAKRRQLVIGTGENYSSPATGTSDSMIAMALDTGAIRWVYQATARDAWNTSCDFPGRVSCPEENGPDFDFGGAGTSLATTRAGRDIVLGAQKSGDVHALDPDSGSLLWKVKLGRGGLLGGVHFGFAVSGDAVIVPINDGEDGRAYPEPARPGLYAVDLATGDRLWSSPAETGLCRGRRFCGPGYAQAITATPDLVFVGGEDGWLRIVNATSGAVLWRFDTTVSVPTLDGGRSAGGSLAGGAGPVAYHGMLFVSSGYGFAGQMPGNLLLAFEAPPARAVGAP
jgi:polyvinyl alcohol dehydrogenase (cytochrome)